MKQVKKIRKFKAAEGCILPLFYKGSIIRISEKEVEIDMEALLYEPAIQLQKAIETKSIIEIGEK